MVRRMEDYIDIVGAEVISSIFKKARRLYNKHICNVNATFLGGGVAEILGRLVPLMNEVGLDAEWRTIHGSPAFFDVTKKFHNAMQGSSLNLSSLKKNLYLDINEEFSSFTHLNYDCIIVHDPQPLSLIKFYKKVQPWIWRCHIDITDPNKELWSFFEKFMLRYDVIVVSSEKYKKEGVPVEQRVIHPAIDPLSLKNMELSQKDVLKYVKKAGIPTDKPVIAQVSRMDPWKDPEGVLEVYNIVREKIDCRLLYCYNLATDDPQGMEIYTKIRKKAAKLVEKGDVIFVVGNNDILVNAVQSFANVIIQKSVKEGFALTVTEALWKAKPVGAGDVGGIPTQIKDGETGFLVDPHDYKACADRVVKFLGDPEFAKQIGNNAKEYVRKNFLTTRLLSDYLDLLSDVMG
ncbi:MAG: glycosyltransferase [Candidatus Omnitrophota bacterium]|nr:MAG: glycosyltransferase [Candidatus Omnitrophota bacterium]